MVNGPDMALIEKHTDKNLGRRANKGRGLKKDGENFQQTTNFSCASALSGGRSLGKSMKIGEGIAIRRDKIANGFKFQETTALLSNLQKINKRLKSMNECKLQLGKNPDCNQSCEKEETTDRLISQVEKINQEFDQLDQKDNQDYINPIGNRSRSVTDDSMDGYRQNDDKLSTSRTASFADFCQTTIANNNKNDSPGFGYNEKKKQELQQKKNIEKNHYTEVYNEYKKTRDQSQLLSMNMSSLNNYLVKNSTMKNEIKLSICS